MVVLNKTKFQNLEYARTLLTKLEQDALAVKVQVRRQELQADLARKRDVFEQLAERLRELEDLSVDSDDDSSEGEDLVSGGVVVHTPSGSPDSRPADHGHTLLEEDEEEGEDMRRRRRREYAEEEADESTILAGRRSTRFGSTATTQIPPPIITTQPAATTTTTTSQNLRPRGPAATAATPAPDKGTTTALREQLLGGGGGGNTTTTTTTTTATTEAILDHHRAEQDALTDSLVRMAASLKQSSRAFATSLETEKTVLDAAGEGLSRNETGLEAAARRMGALTRMAEGRGWWGRILLYAWIFGLMVVAVLIVFVLPKLRF